MSADVRGEPSPRTFNDAVRDLRESEIALAEAVMPLIHPLLRALTRLAIGLGRANRRDRSRV